MIWKVGLTGGIGSGKSTIAQAFSALAVPVFSADAIGHELSQKHQPGYVEIVAHFGDGILLENGEIDRAALGNIVFNDGAQKSKLESILHPMIRQRLHQRADEAGAPYCVLDIPLLINTAELEMVDRVLVVTCHIKTRRSRIKTRNHWSDEKISAVMKNQLEDEILLSAAHDVIDNSGTLDALNAQVLALHHRYRDLSSAFIAQSSKG